jgi:hypothetical protein
MWESYFGFCGANPDLTKQICYHLVLVNSGGKHTIEVLLQCLYWGVVKSFSLNMTGNVSVPTSVLLCVLISEAYSHMKLSLWAMNNLSCTTCRVMFVSCLSLLGVKHGLFLLNKLCFWTLSIVWCLKN